MGVIDRRGLSVDGTTPAGTNDPNSGQGVKAPVRVATTAAITLAGEQTIDTVAVVSGDRVLVKDQGGGTSADNGIWIVNTGPWTRARDFDSASDVVNGTRVLVNLGDENGTHEYYVAVDAPITVGTTPLIFALTATSGGVPTSRTVNGHPLTTNVTVTKSDVGLGNVDNTSDANKPISTATATALASKASTADLATKADASALAAKADASALAGYATVGALALKADSSALSLKADIASPTFTGVPTAPNAAAGSNNTQIATTAYVYAAVASGGGGGGTSNLTNITSFAGVDATGFGDSTAGFNLAIDAANTAGFGAYFIPPGTYKITGALHKMSAPVRWYGAGAQNSIISVHSQSYDVFSWFYNAAIHDPWGPGMEGVGFFSTGTPTAGTIISVDTFSFGTFNDIYIDSCFNGFYFRQTNNMMLTNVQVQSFLGDWGVKAYSDGSSRHFGTDRTDVLSFKSVIIACDSSFLGISGGGVCLWLDGFINTVVAHELRTLFGSRGIYMTNTPGASSPPLFLFTHDWESERTYLCHLEVDASGVFEIYCSNTYLFGAYNAAGVYCHGDIRRIKFMSGICESNAAQGFIFDGCTDVELHGMDVQGNSTHSSGWASGIYLGGGASVTKFTMVGGSCHGANQIYGIDVNSATKAIAVAVDLAGNLSGDTNGSITILGGSSGVSSVFGRTGAVTATTGDYAVANITGAAPLASPTFTGTPAAPTAAVDTNTTQLATTAMVLAQAASATPLIDATSAVVGTSTRFARGDHVHPTDTTRAALASPTFTGTPAAPTATAGTNTTQIATTAFVTTAVGGALDWINVKTQYGAVGNGSTDDTTAINSAIAAVNAGSGLVLYFPAGTYKITAVLTTLTAGSMPIVQGDGPKSSIITTTSTTANVFVVTGGDGTSAWFRDIGITSSATRSAGSFIKMSHTGWGSIERVKMNNVFWGIEASHQGGVIRDCSFNEWDTSPVPNAFANSEYVRVQNQGYGLVIDNMYTGVVPAAHMPFAGINVISCGGLQIINSNIIRCGQCLNVTPSATDVYGIQCLNTFFDNSTSGVVLSPTSTGTVQRVIFTNCQAQSMSGEGFAVNGAVKGVRFSNCLATLNGDDGFVVGNTGSPTDITIDNCLIAGNTNYGVFVGANTTDFSITNCSIGNYGAFGSGNGLYGIITGGTTDKYIITNNRMAGNGSGAISDLASGTNKRVAWNHDGSAMSGPAGTVTSVVAGTGLSGGTINTTGTISLPNSGVTATSYTAPSLTIDAQGRVTAASSVSYLPSAGGTLTGTVVLSGGTYTGSIDWGGSGEILLKFATASGSPGFGNTTTGMTLQGYSDGGTGFFSKSSGPVNVWNVNGDDDLLQCRRSGSQVGRISVTSTTTTFATSSDYRIKKNVEPLTGAVVRLQELKPKRFNFINEDDGLPKTDGFFAHEVQEVVPVAVVGTKDAVDKDGAPNLQSVDHSWLVPLLVGAVQELSARVAALEANRT